MKKKLFISFIAVFILGIALPLGISWNTVHMYILEDFTLASERESELLGEIFVTNANISKEQTENVLRDFSQGVRITYIADDGTVLFDTGVASQDIAKMDDHSDRPEVLEAKNFGMGSYARYSDTLGLEFVYTAQKIQETKAFPAGFLRLAIPTTAISNKMGTLFSLFAFAFLVVLTFAFLMTRYFTKRLSTAIEQMKRVVDNTACKNTELKLLLPPKPEFKELSSAVSEMATRVNNQLRYMITQKATLENILDDINSGVLVLDKKGMISKINSTFADLLPDLFQKTSSIQSFLQQYKGKLPLEVFGDAELEKAIQHIMQSKKQAYSFQHSIHGKVFQINLSKPREIAEIKPDIQLVLVFHDITAIAKLIEIKRDLIANVSHELRTPLTAIQGYAETLNDLLKEEELNKQIANNFIQVIIKNSKHLDRIVKDLLSLSIIENEQDVALEEKTSSTIEQGLNIALEECQALLDAKQVRIVNKLEMKALLAIDADRLSQVFRNLIENAIRYAPQDSEIVLFSESAQNQCAIYVQDFGVGIPEDDMARVFERFYRVEKHRCNQENFSTGLGLSLCKHIVEKYYGSIHALFRYKALIDTNKNVGATIKFFLPYAKEV